MTYLGEGRVCLRDQGKCETTQVNYKINFIQDSCERFSPTLPLAASSLLRHRKNAYFSRISFSLDHYSVS